MTGFNEGSALLALIMLALSVFALRHWLSLRGQAPVDYLRRGVAVLATSMALRLGYWDVLRSAWQYFFDRAPMPGLLALELVNTACNLLIVLAVYQLLKGCWLLLPADERPQYSWLTVAFYPRRLRLRRRD